MGMWTAKSEDYGYRTKMLVTSSPKSESMCRTLMCANVESKTNVMARSVNKARTKKIMVWGQRLIIRFMCCAHPFEKRCCLYLMSECYSLVDYRIPVFSGSCGQFFTAFLGHRWRFYVCPWHWLGNVSRRKRIEYTMCDEHIRFL